MTLKRALEVIRNTHFLPQGGEAKFAYSYTPLPACGFAEIYGTSFEVAVGSVKDGFCSWYHSVEGFRKSKDGFMQLLAEKPDLIQSIEDAWKPAREEVVAYFMHVLEEDLDKKSLPELAEMLVKMGELDTTYWTHVVFIDTFDPYGEDIIAENVKKYAPHLTGKENILITPDELSYSQRQRIDMLEMALAKKKGEDVSERLQKHQKDFFWYTNNFAHPHNLDLAHFEGELKDTLAMTTEELEEELTKRTDDSRARERDELLKDAPKELTHVLDFFRWMTVLRDRRKEPTCLKIIAMRTLFEAIARKSGISVDLLEGMIMWEGMELVNDKENLVKKLEKRQVEAFYMAIQGEDDIVLQGQEAAIARKEIEHDIEGTDEIKGRSASPGVVRGIAKVINKKEDFGIFEEGDILVSTMTRPEYVSLMEKASAVVTDEGGVTCHAAIVSRELGVPCVIGTQYGTKLLKTGDKVEVDADNGIIRRLHD